jgi:hypothetical protein
VIDVAAVIALAAMRVVTAVIALGRGHIVIGVIALGGGRSRMRLALWFIGRGMRRLITHVELLSPSKPYPFYYDIKMPRLAYAL